MVEVLSLDSGHHCRAAVSAGSSTRRLEDGMGEDDWEGWRELTVHLGRRLELTGDDLFVTSAARLKEGIAASVANAIVSKPNQVGTLSEMLGTEANLAGLSAFYPDRCEASA